MRNSLARSGVGLAAIALVYLLGLIGIHVSDAVAGVMVVAAVGAADFVLHNGGLLGVVELVLHGRPKPPAV